MPPLYSCGRGERKRQSGALPPRRERRKGSGKEIEDAEPYARQCERGDGRVAHEHLDGPVAPTERRGRVRGRTAVYLEDAVNQIHDPVVGDTGAGVEAALVVAVQSEAQLAGP